jgi:polyisoprenoid-binding protein YceI
LEVAGDLTVRGIAKPVVVVVDITVAGSNLRFAGKAQVNLKDYGIKPRSAFLFGTKSEMGVEFVLTASPAGPSLAGPSPAGQ